MKKITQNQNWNYRDKTWLSRILKFGVVCCTAAVLSHLFNTGNPEKSNIIFSILFGIAVWLLLIIQRKI